MTPDTKTTLKSVAGLSAVIVATAGGILVATNQILPPAPAPVPVPVVSLKWTNDTAHPWERYRISEVEGTTNLRDWYSVTNTRGNRVTLPAIKPAESFRIHNHYTNVSGW